MKTACERNEIDQRQVEFMITLLGCAVIKVWSPLEREAALGLPSQFSRSLDLRCVAHRNAPPNLQEGLRFYCTRSPIGSKESAKQAQIVIAPASLNLGEGGLPWMSDCLDLEDFFFF